MGRSPGADDDGARTPSPSTGASYEIVVRGRLGRAMVRSLRSVDVAASGPDATYLVGWYEDQAALQQFLTEVGDLGLELSSVRLLDADER